MKIPVALLIGQAIIVSLFAIVFLVMPTVSSAYWTLNAALYLFTINYLSKHAKLSLTFVRKTRHYFLHEERSKKT